jgi:glycosyltransferase involved in cell wall biosynthesis
VFNPESTVKAAVENKIEKIKARKSRTVTRSKDGYITTDNVVVPIYANIGRIEDTVAAVAAGADGVGLLRTELLYLDRNDAPTLQEQTAIYTELFTPFNSQKVIIRTLDAGADKPMAFISFDNEPNPALGVRGYRTINKHENLLRTQLQAIAAAAKATKAEVWVMAPMITLPEEAKNFVAMAKEYGLEKNILILGSDTETSKLLEKASIGILCSSSEGLPVSLLEYGLAGLPVVVTDVGQCAEVVCFGKFGKISKPKDPENLSNSILELLEDIDESKRMGIAFKMHIETEYGAQKFLKHYLEFINVL